MAHHTSSVAILLISLVLPFLILRSYSYEINVSQDLESKFSMTDLVEVILNLKYLECEFYLFGATGKGLDGVAPEFARGGPLPIGGKMANLDQLTRDIIHQFGLQQVGHIRAINKIVKGFPRPLLDISREAFAYAMDQAFLQPLRPPFDAYANRINYLLAAYLISYVSPAGIVGISPQLQDPTVKRLDAGLLGVDAGQDAVIRVLLYEHKDMMVKPYNVTVAEFTNRISMFRIRTAKEGTKDEGIVVPPSEGAEGKVSGNVIAADKDSLSYARTPEEVLRMVYGTGDERVPGGAFPKGANGRIAKYYLESN